MDTYEYIIECKNGNEEAKLKLINKFNPLIQKYTKKISYDNIESVLIIKLLESIEKIDLSKFKDKSEGALVNYFNLALKNRYIDFIKHDSYHRLHTAKLSEKYLENFIMASPVETFIETDYMNYILSTLTEPQKSLLINIFINGKKEIDIAKEQNVSKQSISNMKRRALKKISNLYQNEHERRILYGN